ncbi:hypothetical protein Acr_05g0011310 [Actinidia rufa]|uniref:Retrovirus-related Pol polyprotein from transposon TNT 1-94-like beta-barrel domain-containing protein n=1 Tax=Actinidia rufa TaxID=165716 RepID=A0A7J0EMF5_9ERIC|nr:hypothetical protein Acr_05g0011310 [Actinidia rufa]
MYQAKTSRNKALLMRRLVNLKLQRGTVAEHTSEFQNLVNQLASIDLHFDDEMQALLVLSSLPESWETLVVSLSNSTQDGKLTMSTVKHALFNEEARKKEMGMTDRSESQALISDESRERGREGHIRRNCPKYKTHMQSSKTASASASVMTNSDNDAFLVSLADENSDWVLDSGSAYHFCRDRKMFSTYATCEGLVRMANNTTNKVVGKGTVRFRMADGRSVTLTEGKQIDVARKEDKRTISTGGECPNRKSCCPTWVQSQSGTRAQGDALRHVRKSDQTRPVRPVQDVYRKVQRKETKSILKSCTSTGATSSKRVSFALDLISGSDLSKCVHKGGEREPRQLAK